MHENAIRLGLVPPSQKGKRFLNRKKPAIGLKRTAQSLETKMKISIAHIGKKLSDEHKAMVVRNLNHNSGELSPNWQGGITPVHQKIRGSKKYKEWRTSVFQRDNYTCVECGDKSGGNLNADHIKPFAYFSELRFELSNGRTLCVDCHRRTDTYGGRVLKINYSYV